MRGSAPCRKIQRLESLLFNTDLIARQMSGKYQPDFNWSGSQTRPSPQNTSRESSVPNEQGLMIGLQFGEVATLAR